MARSRAAAVSREADDLAEIEAWYRAELARPAVLPPFRRWEPVRIGPSWQITSDGRWRLPERTLGWGVLAWLGHNLQHAPGEPWVCTLEQARLILWWYALDETGRFLYADWVLQRLKGWGKDPIGACLCLAELIGPVRFAGWADDDHLIPIGRDVPEAWVATAATSLEQTKNTMRLLPTMVSKACQRRYGVQIGKETAHALCDTRLLQAVTSSPRTLEGARHTCVLLGETHHWLSSNDGHEMAAVISRNAAKSAGGAARTVRITNAYMPGEDSVAEHDRDQWSAVQAGEAADIGLLYDSLEAHPESPLLVVGPDGEADPVGTRSAIREVVETVRGDAVWLDADRITGEVLDGRNPPSRSRRFWYNQVVAAEDAWLDPRDVDRNGDRDLILAPGERVVLFGDLSKNDDATALEACRLSDGATFTLNVWTPNGRPGAAVPRIEVKRAILDAISTYDVVACWIDPSAVQDEETGGAYWMPMLDELHRELAGRLELWGTPKTSARPHALVWDMRSPTNDRLFTEAAETFVAEAESGQCPHDAHPIAVAHLKNARRRPNRWGVSLGKENRESKRKVDVAVCKVGARMLRRAVLNREAGTRKRTGFVA